MLIKFQGCGTMSLEKIKLHYAKLRECGEMSKDKKVQNDWTDNAEYRWKLKPVEGIFEVAEGVKMALIACFLMGFENR